MACRLDKFVWCVRLAKTRSKATEAVAKKKVLLNNDWAKPSKEVKVGDEIQILKHNATFTYRVLQLLNNRIGAKLVSEYVLDITPPEEIEKLKIFQASQAVYRRTGDGKPSKKDRRNLDEFLENWSDL